MVSISPHLTHVAIIIGKEKLAEILGVSSNAAKELMTSFLSELEGILGEV